jgi:hypothetical protein
VRPAIKPMERAVRMAANFIGKAFPNSFLARSLGASRRGKSGVVSRVGFGPH